MNIERGDSVKFGEKWCKEHGRQNLINQVIKFTPQWFENDNGLYSFQTECPGIFNEECEEPESIYHLFGNTFEKFMDCQLIKGTFEDQEEYAKIIEADNNTEAESWNAYSDLINL